MMFKTFLVNTFYVLLKCIGVLIVAVAVLINGAPFFLNLMSFKNKMVDDVLTDVIHEPVVVKKVHLSGDGFFPRIVLQQLEIQNHSVDIAKLSIRFNLFKSLWSGKLVTDYFKMDGLIYSPKHSQTSSLQSLDFIRWLLRQPKVVLHQMKFPEGVIISGESSHRNGRYLFKSTIKMPSVFPHKIQLTVQQNKQNMPAIWHMDMSHLHLKGFGNYFNQHVLLQGTAAAEPLSQLNQLLPVKELNPHLVNWLRSAFLQGKITQSQFTLDLPLSDPAKMQYELNMRLDNLTLHYKTGWPDLSHCKGLLTFKQKEMAFTLGNNGMCVIGSNENHIKTLQAHIQDVMHPLLRVDSTVDTNLTAGMLFLKQSPLKINRLDNMSGKGPVNVGIHLTIPFKPGQTVQAQGDVHFLQDELQLPIHAVVLQKLQGQLHFTQSFVKANQLQAQILGNPLVFDLIEPDKNTFVIQAKGLMDVAKFKNHIQSNLLNQVNGKTKVQAKVVWHAAAQAPNTLVLTSDLLGIDSQLPAPFTKPSHQPWVTRIEMVLNPEAAFGELSIQSMLSAKALFEKKNQAFSFVKGMVALGSHPLSMPKHNGLTLRGTIDTIDTSEWKKQFTGQTPTVNHFPSWLSSMHLRVNTLKTPGQRFDQLKIDLNHTATKTIIQLRNQAMLGKVWFFNHSAILFGDFDRLTLAKTSGHVELIPQDLPSLNLKIDRFQLGKQVIGNMDIISQKMPWGQRIKLFSLLNAFYTLHAKGRWIHKNNQSFSTWYANISVPDLGRYLLSRHLSSRLKGGKLNTRLFLQWPGSPFDFQLSTLSGDGELNLKEGDIMHFNTETEKNFALGRFLNVLSLESLSHFLTLDFSLLNKKGFPIRRMEGTFKIHQGVLKTQDVRVEGLIATLEMNGAIGLADNQNDFIITVTPKISSSLPVIIGIAGGPIAGLTAWIANKFLEPSMGKLVHRKYWVTGDWAHPKLRKMV